MRLRGGAEVDAQHPDTYIGLNTVNRQMRREFRPLFFNIHGGVVYIRLGKLVPFLGNFFPDGRVNAPLRFVVVDVKQEDVDTQEWKVLAFLCAKARSSNIKFLVRFDSKRNPGPRSTHSDEEQRRILKAHSGMNALVTFFTKIINALSKAILELVAADLFTKLDYCCFRKMPTTSEVSGPSRYARSRAVSQMPRW
jgi:hypothetical protein